MFNGNKVIDTDGRVMEPNDLFMTVISKRSSSLTSKT